MKCARVATVKTSSPAPPTRLSAPGPPTMVSLPAPPMMVSLPEPPVMSSAPAPPVIENLPPSVSAAPVNIKVPVVREVAFTVIVAVAPTFASLVVTVTVPVVPVVVMFSTLVSPAVEATVTFADASSSRVSVPALPLMTSLPSKFAVPATIKVSLPAPPNTVSLAAVPVLFNVTVTALVPVKAEASTLLVAAALAVWLPMILSVARPLAVNTASFRVTWLALFAIVVENTRRSNPLCAALKSVAAMVRAALVPMVTLSVPSPPTTLAALKLARVVKIKLSSPVPPIKVSAPPPPVIWSLPSPPSSESAAVPPSSVSLPAPPSMVALPFVAPVPAPIPVILSFPAPRST